MRRSTTLVLAGLAWAFLLTACSGDGGKARPFQRPALSPEAENEARHLYLEMVKRAVTDSLYFGEPQIDLRDSQDVEQRRGIYQGSPRALSLLGFENLDNVRLTMEDVLARNVPGDFIEAGAWRGGATIFMRAVLKAHGITDRRVFVADSFEGFPQPNPEIAIDQGFTHRGVEDMIAPLEQVKESFARFGLLDDQVVFLEGWFIDTLPAAPIDRLAVLRVDADLYESTMQALEILYPKLSAGGYVIVDDYGILASCRQAVDEFRREHGVDEEIRGAGWGAIYWQKKR